MKRQILIFSWIGGILLLTLILIKVGLFNSDSNNVVYGALRYNIKLVLIAAIFELLISSFSKRNPSFDVIKFLISWSILWIVVFVATLVHYF